MDTLSPLEVCPDDNELWDPFLEKLPVFLAEVGEPKIAGEI